MSSLRLTHLGPSLCTRRCIWSSACPLSLPRAAEMPQKKKTARGAHLAALNKQHPKREESAGDANDLEYVDKPDDSSSSGESTSGEALPLVQSTLPFSGASSARKKGKNKRPRAAEGPSQRTLADFMPRRPPSLSDGATSQPPADAPADAPTSSPAAPRGGKRFSERGLVLSGALCQRVVGRGRRGRSAASASPAARVSGHQGGSGGRFLGRFLGSDANREISPSPFRWCACELFFRTGSIFSSRKRELAD